MIQPLTRTLTRFAGTGLLVFLLFCCPGQAEAHDASEVRHWEMASPDPDRIFLTFSGDPATSRSVTWRTDKGVRRAYAEIAQATASPNFAKSATRYEATTQALKIDAEHKPSDAETHYHEVRFEGLDPDTLYAYRVGDGEKRWSAWVQFRTASSRAKPFEFLYFGDAQNDVHSRWSRVIRMAHRKAPDSAFAIHAGDLVNRAHADREWAEWMTAGGHLHAEVTGVPVAGNHEYWDSLVAMQWRPQFCLPLIETLPEDLHETVYSFVYQGVQIIVLNSNLRIKEQVPYLEETLKQGDYHWRVVTFHHPLYSPHRGPKEGKSAELRRLWKPIFDRYDVDIVLQGHDHTYARGHTPKVQTDEQAGSGAGTTYVTSVSGPKMYEINRKGLDRFKETDGLTTASSAASKQFFQVLRIDGDRLEYRAYTATGDLFDSVAIEKDSEGNRSFVPIPTVDEGD